MKNIFLLITLLISSHPSLALTLNGAGQNMVIFEYAKQSADYCEKRGIPIRQTIASWAEKGSGLYRKSIEVIRTEAKSRNADLAEQDLAVSESIEHVQKVARENIAKKGIPCSQFEVWLDGLTTLLKN